MQRLRIALGDDEAEACGRCDRCLPVDRAHVVSADGVPELGAQEWLENRPVLLSPSRYPAMSAGIALLDGTLHSTSFVAFMRGRQEGAPLSPRLQELLEEQVHQLLGDGPWGGVVPVPTITWQGRDPVAAEIARLLGVPVLDILDYASQPPARQGELRNNDQRRDNIQGRMCLSPDGGELPLENLLLFDDYTGSGATLKEAGRVIRKEAGFGGELVPLVVARIRWRLGSAGMI